MGWVRAKPTLDPPALCPLLFLPKAPSLFSFACFQRHARRTRRGPGPRAATGRNPVPSALPDCLVGFFFFSFKTTVVFQTAEIQANRI